MLELSASSVIAPVVAVMTMVPAVMVPPMMSPPMPVVADAAWSVMGPDNAAATVGIIIAGRVGRIIVTAIAVEVPPMVVEVRPVGIVRMMMIASAMEDRPWTAAAMKHRATAMEHRTRSAASEGVAPMESRASTTSEHGPAAVEGGTSVEATAATVEPATAMEAATTVKSAAAVKAAASTMTARATHLDGQCVGRRLRPRPDTGTDRRHRKRRPTGCARQ